VHSRLKPFRCGADVDLDELAMPFWPRTAQFFFGVPRDYPYTPWSNLSISPLDVLNSHIVGGSA
jgi:hypothetical protein